MPILEEAGVDLTLTGHSHIYERSMLIDGAYSTPTTARGVVLDDGDGNPAGDGAYLKGAGLQPQAAAQREVLLLERPPGSQLQQPTDGVRVEIRRGHLASGTSLTCSPYVADSAAVAGAAA